MEKNKTGLYVGIVIVLVLGALAYPKVRWFQFEMKVRDSFASNGGLGRFPSKEAMLDIKAKGAQFAKELGIDPLTVTLEIEKRSVGVDFWWYLKADFASGSNTFHKERRVETEIDSASLEWFAENDVKIPPSGSDD
jgi:hypothetical protein